jgi:PKHD-type hydroxylase
MNFYTRKLLDQNQVKNINNIINKANEENLWNDGLHTTINRDTSTKKNLELPDNILLLEINNIIMKYLDNDRKFLDLTVAKETVRNIVSKMIPSGYYNPHIDHWSTGDYSTTVFLNDPNEYDGGELCLFFNDEEKKIKLESGYAVTYPTGTVHRVNRVLSGVRYVSVFWTRSHLKDDFLRNLHYELVNLKNVVSERKMSPIHLLNCNSCKDDPIFVLDNLTSQILRKYGV